MASKEKKRREYREEKLRPPGWDPERENYNGWRFLVDMWMKACDRAKLPKADRGYALFQKNVGSKLVTAAQLGTTYVFSEDAVGQILEVLDQRFKKDQLALKKKARKTFIRLKKEDEEDIDQYIDKFEECYADLMKVGRDLDDETLALQLMESVGLRDELSQLVITGIAEERDDIFDKTKRAMRKYLNWQ